jgi:glutamyl-tRNA reductase
MARRASEVTRAEAIVAEEVDKFAQWLRSRGAVPTVVALRQRFDAIRRSEIERLATTLPPDARARVEDITRLVIEKLLLTPTEQLKALSDPETIASCTEALTRLFLLDPKHDDAVQPQSRDADRRDQDRRDRRVEPFIRPNQR